jgi:hypothetical protein
MFLPYLTYTPLVGTHVRKGYKHGLHKRKITRERRKSPVLKQMYFSVNNDNTVALKYIDLRSSAVRRFQNVNNCLKMTK